MIRRAAQRHRASIVSIVVPTAPPKPHVVEDWTSDPSGAYRHEWRAAQKRKRRMLGSHLPPRHGEPLDEPWQVPKDLLPGFIRDAASAPRTAEFWQQTSARVNELRDVLPVGSLASVVDSFVTARHQDRSLLRNLMREFRDDADQLGFAEIVVTANAYARFAVVNPAFTKLLVHEAESRLAAALTDGSFHEVDARSLAVLLPAVEGYAT